MEPMDLKRGIDLTVAEQINTSEEVAPVGVIAAKGEKMTAARR
jgi:hypothetical protein